MCKDQIGEFTGVPKVSYFCDVLGLRFLMTFQYFHQVRGWSDNSSLSVLQWTETGFISGATGLNQLLDDMDGSMFKVDAIPGQADHFTHAYSGEKRCQIQCLERIALKRIQQSFLFGLIHRGDGFLDDSGQDAEGRRILGDQLHIGKANNDISRKVTFHKQQAKANVQKKENETL